MIIVNVLLILEGRPVLNENNVVLKSCNNKSGEIEMMSKGFIKEHSITKERVFSSEISTMKLLIEQNRQTFELLQEKQAQNKVSLGGFN